MICDAARAERYVQGFYRTACRPLGHRGSSSRGRLTTDKGSLPERWKGDARSRWRVVEKEYGKKGGEIKKMGQHDPDSHQVDLMSPQFLSIGVSYPGEMLGGIAPEACPVFSGRKDLELPLITGIAHRFGIHVRDATFPPRPCNCLMIDSSILVAAATLPQVHRKDYRAYYQRPQSTRYGPHVTGPLVAT